ncbi:MerR family transcriptional regulator [Roseovarius faecimaris]|uniref:MerR family transcriptional regulator n=1 Tax=Roseovarius faecimaris TaxID=2494550 RepID=A0A6I6ISY2_9RHOB|nr:MerR family transcriptional regulator [Roseovarius faecimaris]QGX98627.1 MerR family transcriptional regulator [Roseovarius faecimaris]
MAKSADAFRTISEVAEWLETPAHVLRFWESKFSQVKPVKRAGGRRYYRPADMQLLGGIKRLLHEDGMTIKGVQKILRENGVKHVANLSQPLDEVTEIEASEMAVDVAPIDVPPSTAEVVSFRSEEAKPVKTPAKPAPPAEPEVTAAPAPEPETAAEPDTADTDEVSPSEPPAAEPASPPVMPSFLQRHKEAAAQTESAAEATQDAPAPEPPAITAPDIPEDPGDDTPAEPGPLSTLALLDGSVDPDALARMQELTEQLGSGPG